MVLTGMTSLFYLRVGVGAFATARGHLVSPDLVGLSRAVEPPPELGHRRVGGQHARHCHVPATRHAVLRLARIHAHRAVCLLEMKERDKKIFQSVRKIHSSLKCPDHSQVTVGIVS